MRLSWSAAQTALIGVGMVVFAYLTFHSTFGYSSEDIFSVFAWACGLDLTTNEVTTALRSYKARAKTA